MKQSWYMFLDEIDIPIQLSSELYCSTGYTGSLRYFRSNEVFIFRSRD